MWSKSMVPKKLNIYMTKKKQFIVKEEADQIILLAY